MVTGPDEVSNLPGFEFSKGVFYPLGSILFVLLIPFGLRGSVSTRSKMVMTYIHRLQHLSPITIGQGSFGFTPLLELPELIFGDLRVNLLDLLETFAFFIDLLLYPGSPAGQGGAHVCEGGFVYFIPMIICVMILSGELVSSFSKRSVRKWPLSLCRRFSVLIKMVVRVIAATCPPYPLTTRSDSKGTPVGLTSVISSLTVPTVFGRRSFGFFFFFFLGGLLPLPVPSPPSVVSSSAVPSASSSASSISSSSLSWGWYSSSSSSRWVTSQNVNCLFGGLSSPSPLMRLEHPASSLSHIFALIKNK